MWNMQSLNLYVSVFDFKINQWPLDPKYIVLMTSTSFWFCLTFVETKYCFELYYLTRTLFCFFFIKAYHSKKPLCSHVVWLKWELPNIRSLAFYLTHQEYSINYCWVNEKKPVKQIYKNQKKIISYDLHAIIQFSSLKELLVSNINS